MGQSEPHVGMFPGASEPVGGAGTWANRAEKQSGMNQGRFKYAEMQFIPLGKNNPKQSYVMGGRALRGGTRPQGAEGLNEWVKETEKRSGRDQGNLATAGHGAVAGEWLCPWRWLWFLVVGAEVAGIGKGWWAKERRSGCQCFFQVGRPLLHLRILIPGSQPDCGPFC